MDNNQDRPVVVERETEGRPNNSGPIVAIVAIVVLVVLAVLAYNLFTDDNGTTEDTTNDVELNLPEPAPAPAPEPDTTNPDPVN